MIFYYQEILYHTYMISKIMKIIINIFGRGDKDKNTVAALMASGFGKYIL